MPFSQEDFDRVAASRTATEQFLNMIFNPAKFVEFHNFLANKHEEYLQESIKNTHNRISASLK